MNARTLFLSATMAVAVAGAATLALAADRTVGSGQVKTEQRPASGFQAVEADGSIDVVLRQGTREGVEVRADDNLLPLVETEVVERSGVPTLRIRTARGASFHTRQGIVVTVDLVALTSVTMNGSGDLRAERLQAPALRLNIHGSSDARIGQLGTDELSLNIAGSGDVKAGGSARALTVAIAGSGGVDTRELASEDVKVSIAGSGSARVNARRDLQVSIAGSGEVSYTGDPTLHRSIIGSGSVRKR